MTILTRYLTREIIRHFCIILGVVVIIFLAVLFFEKIDSVLEAGVPATVAFWYFLFKIPQSVSYVFPIALLLAVLITFGLMSKHNELIALKSSGVSIFHLFKPVATLGVLSAVLLFLLSDIVVPTALTRANRIWLQEVKGVATFTGSKWIKGNHSFFKIGRYDPEGQVISGLTAYYLDDQQRFRRRMDAKRAEFEGGEWVLQDLLVQDFDPGTEAPKVSSYSRETVDIGLQPEQLLEITPETEEMSCKALWAVIQKMEAEGDDATRYRVDLQYKMAFPMVCLVMCLIGTAIAVRRKLKGGLPIIVSYGIGITFLYFITMSICVSFGYGGILPPVAAAWAAHVIFLCAGGVALISAQA